MQDIPTAPIADAPKWLLDLCAAKTRVAVAAAPAVPVPPESAEQRATEYLLSDAPEAFEGSRNHTLFVVAARVRDFGAPYEMSLGLIQQYWNGVRCQPALDDVEVERTVRSAYTSAQNPMGCESPQGVFASFLKDGAADKIAAAIPEPVSTPPIVPVVFNPEDPRCALISLPTRQWVLGRFLLAGKVTVLVAPPGVGKSLLTVAAALSVASGRALLGDSMGVTMRGPVLMINNEDDPDEIYRRVYAAMRGPDPAPRISEDAIRGQLHIHSGVERPFVIARRRLDGTILPVDYDTILAYLKTHKIKLLIADPLVETHHCDENSNVEMAHVARLYRKIAKEADCAVLLVHHTRKPPMGKAEGYAGSQDGGRGASSIMGVARIAATLYTMTDKEAKAYGIPPSQRSEYVRLDDAKANLAPMRSDALWLRKVSVKTHLNEETGTLVPADISPVLVEDKSDAEQVKPESSVDTEATIKFVQGAVAGSPVPLTPRTLVDKYKTEIKERGLTRKDVNEHIKAALMFGDLEEYSTGSRVYLRVPSRVSLKEH